MAEIIIVALLPIEATNPITQTEDNKATASGKSTPRTLLKQKKRINNTIIAAIIPNFIVFHELSDISAIIKGIPK